MKIKLLQLCLISGFLLFSCAPDVAYQNFDNFTITENGLENNSKLELMYSSASPKDEAELSYFIHIIGVVQNTNDTVNVLTCFNQGAGGGAAKNVFKYYTLDSEEGKAYFEKMYNQDSGQKHDIAEIMEITRVTYDKRFDYIAKNNFRTVIGFIEK